MILSIAMNTYYIKIGGKIMVKIVFYKSSSRYYDQACLISETFNNYSNINEQNVIQVDIEEINEKRKEFNSVCDIIKNWHRTE